MEPTVLKYLAKHCDIDTVGAIAQTCRKNFCIVYFWIQFRLQTTCKWTLFNNITSALLYTQLAKTYLFFCERQKCKEMQSLRMPLLSEFLGVCAFTQATVLLQRTKFEDHSIQAEEAIAWLQYDNITMMQFATDTLNAVLYARYRSTLDVNYKHGRRIVRLMQDLGMHDSCMVLPIVQYELECAVKLKQEVKESESLEPGGSESAEHENAVFLEHVIEGFAEYEGNRRFEYSLLEIAQTVHNFLYLMNDNMYDLSEIICRVIDDNVDGYERLTQSGVVSPALIEEAIEYALKERRGYAHFYDAGYSSVHPKTMHIFDNFIKSSRSTIPAWWVDQRAVLSQHWMVWNTLSSRLKLSRKLFELKEIH